jgi:hypothetical protein
MVVAPRTDTHGADSSRRGAMASACAYSPGAGWTRRYPWIVHTARTSWNADIRVRLELPVFDIVDCRCE